MFNFESHVTVMTSKVDKFREVCEQLKVKAIVIAPDNDINQVMTSETFKADDLDTAKQRSHKLSYELIDADFDVIRIKIECCPKYIEHANVPFYYWEVHVPCISDKLEAFDIPNDWHISRNEFKPNVTMLTYRSKSIQDQIIMMMDFDAFKANGLTLAEKPIIEYAVYDTNIELDNKWLRIN